MPDQNVVTNNANDTAATTATPLAAQQNENGKETKYIDPQKNKYVLGLFASFLFVIIILGGWYLFQILRKDDSQTELLMGLLIVCSIAALMTLLYSMAAGFSFMGLTDRTKPLGLPEGSIRAMIALILIMVFIIFGIFTLKSSSNSVELKVAENISKDALGKFDLKIYREGVGKIRVDAIPDLIRLKDAAGRDSGELIKDTTYNVYYSSKPSEESSRLSQQILTTVGTLVVSIASFYFGSATVSSAMAQQQKSVSGDNTDGNLTTDSGAAGGDKANTNTQSQQATKPKQDDDEGSDPIGNEDVSEPTTTA